ncbi:MAG: hypothetical protein EA409_10415 [Saprospirales bacterium]|nr:MAG: hypothetical protein EA409_10415 [Saprospirales bacterium]
MTVFKGKLVDQNSYYRRRRYFFIIFFFLYPLFIALSVNLWDFPLKWSALSLLLIAAMFYLMYKTSSGLKKSWKGTHIEIEPDEIRIVDAQRGKSELLRTADLNNIVVPGSFGIAGDTFRNLKEEISGKPLRNYIQFEYRGKKFECHFIPETYYMLNQLEKILDEWKKRGLVKGKAEQVL